MIQELTLIEKEKISDEKFIRHEVLLTIDDINTRRQMLEKATVLGNAHHHKVKIVFETVKGLHQVETTVWECSEGTISLKGGVLIPSHCIWEVQI